MDNSLTTNEETIVDDVVDNTEDVQPEKSKRGRKKKIQTNEDVSTDSDVNPLEDKVKELQKKYGHANIHLGNEVPEMNASQFISSGYLSLDWVLGGYGLPRGRVVELYGPEGGGKSSVALKFLRGAQNMGLVGGIVDAEHSMSDGYLKSYNIDVANLIMTKPDSGEEGINHIRDLISVCDYIMIDSVAALVPHSEMEAEEAGKSQMGSQARLLSSAMRILVGPASKRNVTLVFINQTRQNIGNMYGPKEVTTGGNALKFYASVRARISRVEEFKPVKKELIGDLKTDEIEPIGHKAKIKIIKNKIVGQGKVTEFEIFYGEHTDPLKRRGIPNEYGLIREASRFDVLKKDKSSYSFGNKAIAVGAKKLFLTLCQDQKLYKQIYDATCLAREKYILEASQNIDEEEEQRAFTQELINLLNPPGAVFFEEDD